jgi:hypothetical protein
MSKYTTVKNSHVFLLQMLTQNLYYMYCLPLHMAACEINQMAMIHRDTVQYTRSHVLRNPHNFLSDTFHPH